MTRLIVPWNKPTEIQVNMNTYKWLITWIIRETEHFVSIPSSKSPVPKIKSCSNGRKRRQSIVLFYELDWPLYSAAHFPFIRQMIVNENIFAFCVVIWERSFSGVKIIYFERRLYIHAHNALFTKPSFDNALLHRKSTLCWYLVIPLQ